VSCDGYYADITRTFPANGKFSPRQREIYAIVLEAQYAAIDTFSPGSTIHDAHVAVYETFKRHNVAEFSYGGCCHPVGLTIHDPHGRYSDDRHVPLEPGVVVVIEPFLMMTDDGFGIRIEDGVLITEDGHEILSAPPKEIDALEDFIGGSMSE
jgi:Xaa-Pro aminopeptidase